jgi:mannose-6-phosphate isomerase
MSEKRSWVHSQSEVKRVTKPWGNATIDRVESVGELWLNYEQGEEVGAQEKRYVFKLLFVKKGTKMSFQYHMNKLETNYLVSGVGEALLENEQGEMETSLVTAGDSWTIPCGKKHCLIALSDIVMLEASTPEVDDVVRIQDDAGRGSGRIDSEHVK